MITLPNYDDQTFQDIMETARRRIPVIYPQWTDLNEHDPGITILELFAWLKEMQQYHLNRISTRSYASMLKLLGVTMGEPAAAQTRLGLSGGEADLTLPRGMRFQTREIVFECRDSVRLNSLRIENIYVGDGSVFKDVRDMIREPGIYCHVFGAKPVEGSSALYLGFDRLEKDREIALYFQIDDGYPVPRNPFQGDSPAPRDILWEYGAAGKTGLEFKPVQIVTDNTFGFSRSGELIFKINGETHSASPGGELPARCWLRARLLRKGCEENPRLAQIWKDTVPVLQRQTRSETIDLMMPEIDGAAVWELRNWLALRGEHLVFVRDALGWQNYPHFEITVRAGEEKEEIALLKLMDLPPEPALDGAENIRILCYEAEFGSLMVLGDSAGLPCQRFSFQAGDTVLKEHLAVMVYEETEAGPKRWTDWRYVADLSQTGPYDRCFTYDSLTEEVVFGDNEHGAVPLAGENNIMVTGCAVTKGHGGNIGVQDFSPLEYQGVELLPAGLYPARGGSDEESVKTALERFKMSMKQRVRAVTAADYETLAAATPGLRVRGVRAIPYYDPDSKVVGDKQTAATVTIVALPYSEEPFPEPDSRFLLAIRHHLEQYRLITTNLKVIGPSYVKISLYAEVMVDGAGRDNLEENLKRAVERYFEGLREGIAGGKPAFGQPVLETVLAMKIGEAPGIIQVKKLTLGVKNGESYLDKDGNIILPPHGLPYPGDIQIRTFI